MEAKDGRSGFDFEGTYEEVKTNELLAYVMSDGRKARITFASSGAEITMEVTFDAETLNPIEMQRDGWQAILNSFKKYVETGS